MEKVGQAHHADEASARIHDGEAADVMLTEELLGVLDRSVDRDRDGIHGHEIRDA